MRWETDLTKDIRTHSELDDRDLPGTKKAPQPDGLQGIVPDRPAPFYIPGGTVSKCNQRVLLGHFLRVKDKCDFIMEIGVDRDGRNPNNTTNIFLKNKNPKTVYLGIDINPKTHLDDEENNIYTLQSPSENYETVFAKIEEINAGKIGFLMIDGWHSINQVLQEWEYVNILEEGGIVAFHDTRYHPGPHLFLKYLDRTKWNVIEDACSEVPNNEDYGIGFVWKKD